MKSLPLRLFRVCRGQLLGSHVMAIGAISALAQSPPAIPPGVPEPGLIIWGSVVNATNTSQQIQITSASWSVTDGSNSAIYAQSTRPPVQIITLAGQSHYVLEVPFDTRRFGTVMLSDPIVEGIRSFELKASQPPDYRLMPTINGVPASVRLIDNNPATGTNVLVPGFTAAVRGRVIRVDLAITPITETYEQWAARIFGSGHPNAGPGADPDHDGFTNAGEYAAGTDPLNAASVLRILTITVTENQTMVGWQSVADKQYVLEAVASINGSWTAVSSNRAAGSTAQTSVNRNLLNPERYYRVRVLPP